MNNKLLTEHNFRFLSLTGGCTGSSESTLVKMPHCWKSRVMAHMEMKPRLTEQLSLPNRDKTWCITFWYLLEMRQLLWVWDGLVVTGLELLNIFINISLAVGLDIIISLCIGLKVLVNNLRCLCMLVSLLKY